MVEALKIGCRHHRRAAYAEIYKFLHISTLLDFMSQINGAQSAFAEGLSV